MKKDHKLNYPWGIPNDREARYTHDKLSFERKIAQVLKDLDQLVYSSGALNEAGINTDYSQALNTLYSLLPDSRYHLFLDQYTQDMISLEDSELLHVLQALKDIVDKQFVSHETLDENLISLIDDLRNRTPII